MAAIRRRAAASAGFTLIELMVVVVMISILAIIATPGMRVARDDRLAFDYARRIEQLIHRSRARAAGRGAAHLILVAPSGAPSRGKFFMFEGLDGTVPAAGGPNPVSTCKTANQWTDAVAYLPGAVSNNNRFIDGFDLDSAGVNANADIRTAYSVTGLPAGAIAICVTPGGATYVGKDPGGSVTTAITDMQAQTVPFNSFLDITVTRNQAGVPIGLARHVLVAGSAAPRIRSL